MHVSFLIERKRDGEELTEREIGYLIREFTAGRLPDYQMSAFAMAVYFRGMMPDETAALTRAMVESGHVLRYPKDSPRVVDKHSTGGVGDKVSLVLAPLLACDGVWVPMILGRGLGITGGTLDKLESIPGFDVALGRRKALRQLERIGVFMIGQTDDICPADRSLYALRDVTATVPSQPLIIASIMSKKLAESLDALVLDVKFGSGALMRTREDAESLRAGLIQIGERMGVDVTGVLSPMDEPLGRTVGNALEVVEAVEALQGRGPADLERLVLDLAERVSETDRETFAGWLRDGTAWERFVALVRAQGGEARVLETLGEVHRAPVLHDVLASKAGVVVRMDAGLIGRACMELGAGRRRVTDSVDFAVGCSAIRKTGETVAKGEVLLRVHARTKKSLRAVLPIIETAVVVE